jgi:hypothetical protein
VLDWLASKVAMTLAALLMLAGVAGFFLAQRDRAVQDALDTISKEAAAFIDGVSRSAGEMATSISVGPPPSGAAEGLELPALAAGQRYSLVLYPSYVVADGGGPRAAAVLRTPVHLWDPDGGPLTLDDVAEKDRRNPSLAIGGGTLALRRQSLPTGGSPVLETFAFL